MDRQEIDDLFEQLEAEGCIIYNDDRTMFKPTEKFETLHPGLLDIFNEAQLEEIESTLLDLILKGLVEFGGVAHDGEMLYSITPMGREYIENLISNI